MIGLGQALSLALASQRSGGLAAALDAPTGFAVDSRTDTTITVTWDAVQAGIRTFIQWQIAGEDWSSPLGDQEAAPAQVAAGLAANTAYDFRLRSMKGSDLTSDWVVLAGEYTRPATPTGFAATPGGPYEVYFTWDLLPVGCTARLYQDGVPWGIPPEVLLGTSYTHFPGSAGETHNYTLSFVSDASGLESELSASVSGTSGTDP